MKNKIILMSVFVFCGIFFSSVAFADTTVNLQIKNGTSTIYDGDITVSPCDSEGDGVLKETPYCAIVQSGTASDWAGLWVNSIGGVLNNDGGNGVYWMWLSNLSIDNCPTCSYSLSGKQYVLQNGDKILFYYNTNPLDISVDKTNPKVGESITIKGKELGLDSSWNPVWNNASNGQVLINGVPNDLDANGELVFNITSGETLSLKIKKSGFIDSKELTVIPEEVKRSGSSGSYIQNFVAPVVIIKSFSVDNAFNFLYSNKASDGFYGSPLYTDWVAVAVGAGGSDEQKNNLIKYLTENNLDSSLVTDNERRAMALMSLGINPYTGTKVNYIKKIVDSFDGTQFGDKDLYNDDIFALVVLKNAGYTTNDEIISKDIKYLIGEQEKDGSWGSIDMTAAYVEAMRGFEKVEGVSDSVSRSENYIISNQKIDGGFENASSTAWVLQSMFSNEQILKAEKYLASKQESDGGVGELKENKDSRVWTTAYAIPAVLHKNWGEILYKFPKQDIVVPTPVINVLNKDKKEVIAAYRNNKIENKQKKLELIQSDIVKPTNNDQKKENNGFFSKVSSFWGNTRHSFSWLLDKLSF